MSDLLELAQLAVIVNGPAMRQASLMRAAEREESRKQRALAVAISASAQNEPGRIYFAECGDFIKIGYTLSVERRIASLSTGNPAPISVLLVVKGKRGFERHLHNRFAKIRSRGEWFEKHPDLLSFIAELKSIT